MAIKVDARPDPERARLQRNLRHAARDTDVRLFSRMTQEQVSTWIDTNCLVDDNTKRLLKVFAKVLTGMRLGR